MILFCSSGRLIFVGTALEKSNIVNRRAFVGRRRDYKLAGNVCPSWDSYATSLTHACFIKSVVNGRRCQSQCAKTSVTSRLIPKRKVGASFEVRITFERSFYLLFMRRAHRDTSQNCQQQSVAWFINFFVTLWFLESCAVRKEVHRKSSGCKECEELMIHRMQL